MSHSARVTLRETENSDLDTFFVHQLDPESIRLAAFIGREPADRAAFDAHWAKILSSPKIIQRTIVADGRIVGSVACFPMGEEWDVTYWLGREFWGRGFATDALRQLLQLVTVRPLFARAAKDNTGSVRVLQKCGFTLIGEDKGFALGRGVETEEYILPLDAIITGG